MLAFYRMLYPFKPIFKWLNHEQAPTKLFTHREFAFTLQGDVYLRYNSFNTADELKKQVCALNPTRFEIGPMYTAKPKDKKTVRPAAFSPLKRELVFDIDMTDYDSIRTCCSGAGICRRCWGFIAAAVDVIDSAITEQFGFKELLWVYSGRRGIHLWISDPEAMDLTDEQRKAIVGYLTVIEGGKEMRNKVNVRMGPRGPLPPSLQSAVNTLDNHFDDLILDDQDCFRSDEGWESLLQLIPDRKAVDTLRKNWSHASQRSSKGAWADLKKHMKDYPAVVDDIILQYTYPRLDTEVSKHRNHLLKAPFCVHPKTGRVCVPVDAKKIHKFDPSRVPTVHQLLRELDAGASADSAAGGSAWERTSLKPYVEMLERHNATISTRVRQDKIKQDKSW
ncbi:hypothetical protein SERLA73DRAFT_175568 [Serpula lacrymans var. lacrymans S7.3]|uniref:DNA primase n=2 Tax=Serpula lacrymans var. lacrymans TaxID=341189 RepID=F8PKG1_SERL3|nr:uncharacterized protein SERLADRAFT_458085 [Serpula lacrymans var. lacrymans S7.9]EGO03875.1 hypothetical protein SERLA73DRAFT_175568 [Serpula lacrymans var. lacrymans S7.3]EGO29802.1 hypothetical protein SERLADRAFT_458085 [Serpula lacrymans var. lacrymans S7.9]